MTTDEVIKPAPTWEHYCAKKKRWVKYSTTWGHCPYCKKKQPKIKEKQT